MRGAWSAKVRNDYMTWMAAFIEVVGARPITKPLWHTVRLPTKIRTDCRITPSIPRSVARRETAHR